MTTSPNETVSGTSSWVVESYADFRYLDTNVSGLRFSQGLVWNEDAGEWISSWQFGLARLDSDFQFLQTTGSVDTSTLSITSGIPQVLADMGLDHIGDIDYYNGKLYISLDNSEVDYQTGYVAVFNASDLSYTGTLYELVGAPSNPHNDIASWVAIDAEAGLGYGKEYQMGNTINIYSLEDWSFQGTLEMDQSLKSIQGAKVLDGMMYMSSDNSTRSVYSVDMTTGHVTELFQLPGVTGTDMETEGLEVRKNADGQVEITVELIVDPEGDIYADTYTRVFTYVLSEGSSVPLTHTWTVNSDGDTTNANDLSLTLREAIAKADAGDTITFDASLAGDTITLGDVELALSKNITIEGDLDGDGKSDITVTTSGTSPVFHITGGTAILNGLLVTNSEESDGSSVVVGDDGALTFTNGATTDLQTRGDDVLTGANGFDAILGGAGDDIIQGLRGKDLLYGEAGNDLLIGGAGADTMVGGAGDDSYVVSEDGDVVTELKNRGTDLVKASFSYALGDNVENLTLMGTADLNGTGNGLANALTGNAGVNTLSGLAGNDKLMGWAGDDTLNGGSGGDTLNGGDGADALNGGSGKDALTGGAGADRFVFAFGDTAATKSKADTIFDLQGNKGDMIDLHLIDAKESKAGDQAFSFIGTDTFSGHAGELRYEKAGGETYIYGDTDGDTKVDFAIHLDDAISLKADYFVL
jgi:Ca2+-binding RTX toxin-like protein